MYKSTEPLTGSSCSLVVALTLPFPSLKRFSQAVTLKLRWRLFLLNPFAVLSALIVKSGRSRPEISMLKVKKRKTCYINIEHNLSFFTHKQSILFKKHSSEIVFSYTLAEKVNYSQLEQVFTSSRPWTLAGDTGVGRRHLWRLQHSSVMNHWRLHRF